jgi:hypothetical protein
MLEIIVYLFKPAAVVAALLALSFLIVTIARSRHLPQCFSCGAMKVRPSRPDGILDHIRGFFLIRPHRCSGCRERFYAVRLADWSRPSGSRAHRQGSVRVVFRFKNGIVNRVAIRQISKTPSMLQT